MKREHLRTLALVGFVFCAVSWLIIRLPRYIYNFAGWVDIGFLVFGGILVALWLLDQGEKR